MKNKKEYLVRFGGNFYSNSTYQTNLRDAKIFARKMIGVNKLPNGTEFWKG